jgi:hypothetical protein
VAAAAKTFDGGLRAVIHPALAARGFVFDGNRTYRRELAGGVLQLVNFQLGQRSLEGHFAVNLGVYVPGELDAGDAPASPARTREYHCAWGRRERLARVRPVRFPRLGELPWLSVLFGPSDTWWRHAADERVTCASLAKALELLEQHGFAWLDRMTPPGDMRR